MSILDLRILAICSFATLAMTTTTLLADQQVTLRSGTTIVGAVTLEGESVAITVDGSDITVPLTEVASIAPVGTEDAGQARRMLLMALESQVFRGSRPQQPGLLAEAYRLDPDDTRIAFWYAFSLEAAGHGKSAETVFSKKRNQIMEAYPGFAQALAERIEKRMKFESLPHDLVERIDSLERGLSKLNFLTADKIPVLAYFLLVDQDGNPVSEEGLRISGIGSNHEISSFDEGYYVYTASRNRSSSSGEASLFVNKPGYELKKFQFKGASDKVKNLGKFVVKRFNEQDKQALSVRVVDPEGAPIDGATVSFRGQSNFGSTMASQSNETDKEGLATASLFPMRYSISAQKQGHVSAGKTVGMVKSETPPKPVELTLWPLIPAKFRVEWQVEEPGPTLSTWTGEGIIDYPMVRGHDSVNPTWLHVSQMKDNLVATVGQQHYMHGTLGNGIRWVRVLASGEGARGVYDKTNLEELGSLKKNLKPPKDIPRILGVRTNSSLQFVVQKGDAYIGETTSRSHRGNGVSTVRFKVFVE